jgi:hypothetical protein
MKEGFQADTIVFYGIRKRKSDRNQDKSFKIGCLGNQEPSGCP